MVPFSPTRPPQAPTGPAVATSTAATATSPTMHGRASEEGRSTVALLDRGVGLATSDDAGGDLVPERLLRPETDLQGVVRIRLGLHQHVPVAVEVDQVRPRFL